MARQDDQSSNCSGDELQSELDNKFGSFYLDSEEEEVSEGCRQDDLRDIQNKLDTDSDFFESNLHVAMVSNHDPLKLMPKKYTCALKECQAKKEFHLLVKCPLFLSMTPQKRDEHIRNTKKCRNCFNDGHMARQCTKEFFCKECKKRHHTMLHGFDQPPTEDNPQLSCISYDDEFIPFITLILENPDTGKRMEVNAMMDTGNTKTMVSKEAADILELDRRELKTRIRGLHSVEWCDIASSSVLIKAKDSNYEKEIKIRIYPQLLEGIEVPDWSDLKNRYPHLKNLKIHPPAGKRIHILLGQDQAGVMRAPSDLHVHDDLPIGRQTPLGWTVFGRGVNKKYVDLNIPTALAVRHALYRNEEWIMSELYEMCQKYFEVEETEEKGLELSNDDRYALRSLQKSISQAEDGRYSASCLWKKGEPSYQNNMPMALSRLAALSRSKEMRTSEQWDEYYQKFREYEEKGYVTKVPITELKNRNVFYLPHFPVVKVQKDGNKKIRPVFDGSQKYYNKSLNDGILVGPKIMNDCRDVTLIFRKGAYAVIGDLKEMFLQIGMYPQDQDHHRFLVQFEKEGPIQEYKWLRHPFGNTGSPFVAMLTLRNHAEKFQDKYPEAVELIKKATVVDDTLWSSQSAPELSRQLSEIQHIYKAALCQLHKFSSNSEPLLDQLPMGTLQGDAEYRKTGKIPNSTALGMVWNPNQDLLSFQDFKQNFQEWTKRTMLSCLSSVYDPLGILMPVHIIGKTHVKNVWMMKKDWDEKIPEEIEEPWTEWFEEMKRLPEFQIPRALQPDLGPIQDTELHTFGDASEKAFGAVSYLKTKYESGEVMVRQAMAKGRITKMKRETIPRLELQAAVLALGLSEKVGEALKIKPKKRYLWTDSKCVLSWIKTPSKTLKAYIGHRTQTIQDKGINNWYWVDTENNPADLITRGMTLEELKPISYGSMVPSFFLKRIMITGLVKTTWRFLLKPLKK